MVSVAPWHQKQTSVVPPLDQIRPVVEREWANDTRLESRKKINEELRKRYEIIVEWPEGMKEASAPEEVSEGA